MKRAETPIYRLNSSMMKGTERVGVSDIQVKHFRGQRHGSTVLLNS